MSSSLILVKVKKINVERLKKLRISKDERDMLNCFLKGEATIGRLDWPNLFFKAFVKLSSHKEIHKILDSAGWDADQLVPVL